VGEPTVVRLRFGPSVVLSKDEAFGACQALADAGSHLIRSGRCVEADALAGLFVLLEERLSAARPDAALPGCLGPAAGRWVQSSRGSNSSESEFTQ
jgi:hypothetical protein